MCVGEIISVSYFMLSEYYDFFLKNCVSEICVKQIHVKQGFGVKRNFISE